MEYTDPLCVEVDVSNFLNLIHSSNDIIITFKMAIFFILEK